MRLIQNGRPAPDLLTLCCKYGIRAPDEISPQALNAELQQRWFQEGFLRYQIKGEPPCDEDRTLLRTLGFIDEIPPPTGVADRYDPETRATLDRPLSYTGMLLLGALRSRIVSRLFYLTTVASRLTFNLDWKIYLLGGARPLDPEKESPFVLCTPAELPFLEGWIAPETLPTTEAEMMKLVWQQSRLPMHWRAEIVYAPMQPKPNGGTRPPNTADTVRVWLSDHQPPPGTYLALSNQPFVQYQELVLQRLVPSGFAVYTCGPAASPTLPLATYLDNIAKQLYEELAAHPAA